MKRLWILLCTLAALSVATWALASCLFPTGSAGGNGWNHGVTQSYIVDVAINAFDNSALNVRVCDIVTDACNVEIIDFGGRARFIRGGADWHGTKAWPLRAVSVVQNCAPNPATWCIAFYGDEDVGDHVNQFQNGSLWYFDAAYAHPLVAAGATAPFGNQIVKIAGMTPSPAQTLRINYVNSTVTGIATKDIFLSSAACP